MSEATRVPDPRPKPEGPRSLEPSATTSRGAPTDALDGLPTADHLLALADRLLETAARHRGVDAAEVFLQAQRTLLVQGRGELTSSRETMSGGMCVRVVTDGRHGLSTAAGVRGPAGLVLDRAARCLGNAVEGADEVLTDGDGPHGGTDLFPQPRPLERAPSPLDEDLAHMDPARHHELVARIMDATAHPDRTFVAAGITSTVGRFVVANSHGVAAWDQGCRETLHLESRHTRGGRHATGWEASSDVVSLERQIDVEDMARGLAERLASAASPGSLERPVKQAVLGPGGTAQLFSQFTRGLGANLWQSGQSPVQDRIGDTIATEVVTLHDAPHTPSGEVVPRMRVDHEGTPTRLTPIIERGVLKDLWRDQGTARTPGAPPTNGHGIRRRGWQGRPEPAAIHPRLAPGVHGLDRLIGEIDDGVYVPDPLTGVFTSNATTGDFSVTAPYAFRIERGALAGALGNTTITGNVFEVLRGVLAVGDTVHARAPGSYGPIATGGLTCVG